MFEATIVSEMLPLSRGHSDLIRIFFTGWLSKTLCTPLITPGY